MFAIGKRLLGLATQPAGTEQSAKKFSFGHVAVDPAERLSAMSAAAPDAENKWQLTNMAGIGSDEDKVLREKAAESEAEFEGAGQEAGIEIWRVEKFEPKRIELRADNISLFSGDCYIVLKTTKIEDSDALKWELHYWIGKDSTQDESGSAAVFTVNLDDLLDQKVRISLFFGSFPRRACLHVCFFFVSNCG